jgi:Ser-tRNA(Ala) deacylase AlaX
VKSTGEIGCISIKRGKKPGKGRERMEILLSG